MASYIKEIGNKGISLQFLWNLIGGLIRSLLIIFGLITLGGGSWLMWEGKISIFMFLIGLVLATIFSILVVLLCNRSKLRDEQVSSLLSVMEMNRVYTKDTLILESLEKMDLTDRDDKETRDTVDGFLESIDTSEGKAALVLLLKRKNYSNYNPDERIIENSRED